MWAALLEKELVMSPFLARAKAWYILFVLRESGVLLFMWYPGISYRTSAYRTPDNTETGSLDFMLLPVKSSELSIWYVSRASMVTVRRAQYSAGIVSYSVVNLSLAPNLWMRSLIAFVPSSWKLSSSMPFSLNKDNCVLRVRQWWVVLTPHLLDLQQKLFIYRIFIYASSSRTSGGGCLMCNHHHCRHLSNLCLVPTLHLLNLQQGSSSTKSSYVPRPGHQVVWPSDG